MNEDEFGLAETANYEYARQVGDQLFVAGQVPHDVDGNLIGVGDPGKQATQCLKNLQTLLSNHGFELGDIQHLMVYVVGEQQCLKSAWAAVEQFFDKKVPPATLLGVALLGYENQVVEIDATVVKSA